MNLLLVEASELDDRQRVSVAGPRAAHLVGVLRVVDGSEVRVGVIDGPIGVGRVTRVGVAEVELTCRFEGEAPPRPKVDLLLALPRPKVLKRLYAPLAALGVGRIILTGASKVERYYFDSHAVTAEVWRPRLLEGLAQARDTRVPSVHLMRSLRATVDRWLSDRSEKAQRLLADPLFGACPHAEAREHAGRRTLLALGPEGGWSDRERLLLRDHGFRGVGLGPRALRSDTACVALLSLVHAGHRAALAQDPSLELRCSAVEQGAHLAKDAEERSGTV